MNNKMIAIAFMFLCSSSSMAMGHAVSVCAKTFIDCALAIANDTYASDNLVACQENYQYCSAPPRSKECYLAEEGWQTVRVIAGLTAGAFVGVVFVLPHGLALYAHLINKAAAADVDAHPYLSSFGKWMVTVRDTDGDGKVTGTELLKPQIAYGVVGVGFLSEAIAKAFEYQALCDFTKDGGVIGYPQ